MSYLYIIECQGMYYKVGIAGNVATRLADLQTGNPYQLNVLSYFQFDNPGPIEQSIHQRFSEKWKMGEWYKLNLDDLKLIEQICTLLGGTKQNAPVEVEEESSDDDAAISETQVEQMIADGWRIEVMGGGRYYTWRRGSRENREQKSGGYFADLPKERQDEYYRNRDRRNGACQHCDTGGKAKP